MDQFDEVYDEAMDKINEDFETYTGEGSGWILDQIESVDLHIARYKPIRGSSYIETPVCLVKKRAIVNIQNEDMLCFLYCIIAFLYPVTKHTERVKQYEKYLERLNYKDIEMPMAVAAIDNIEKMNYLIINIYGCNEDGSEI